LTVGFLAGFEILNSSGAGGLGVASTFFLPNTLEDFLGIAVGAAVGYAALLNLPLKRNDAKEKLMRVANNFAEVSSFLPQGSRTTQTVTPPPQLCGGELYIPRPLLHLPLNRNDANEKPMRIATYFAEVSSYLPQCSRAPQTVPLPPPPTLCGGKQYIP